MSSPEPPADDAKAIAEALKSYLDRNRISREALAEDMKVGKSTIDKACIGIFTDRFLNKFYEYSRIDLRARLDTGRQAPPELGSYSVDDVADYIGTYHFIRFSFEDANCIMRYLADISWDHEQGGAVVRIMGRDGNERLGHISMPARATNIFILSNFFGWISNLILSQLEHDGSLKGIMLASAKMRGPNFTPVATPVLFQKTEMPPDDDVFMEKLTGEDEAYGPCFARLKEIFDHGYARYYPHDFKSL